MKTRISKNDFYIYILRSLKDDSFYVGYTSDVQKRLKEHNLGRSSYTKNHLPYQLVYSEEFSTKKEAKARELYIKRYGNISRFLKSRVPPNFVRDISKISE